MQFYQYIDLLLVCIVFVSRIRILGAKSMNYQSNFESIVIAVLMSRNNIDLYFLDMRTSTLCLYKGITSYSLNEVLRQYWRATDLY